jgi:hypothetical protein
MASGHGTAPHKQAEHMAAPTSSHHRQKTLANREPSTHGYQQRFQRVSEHDRLGSESRHCGCDASESPEFPHARHVRLFDRSEEHSKLA